MEKKGEPTRRYHFYQGFKFFPNFNRDVCLLTKKEQEIIEDWQAEKIHTSVEIFKCEEEEKGLGVRAAFDIEAGEFLSLYCGNNISYLGDVVPRCFGGTTEYAFQYCFGPLASQDFNIVPQKNWSIGPFLNYGGSQRRNVSTIKGATEKEIVVVLYASRAIRKGEELLYDYNGAMEAYNTKGWE